MTNTDTCRSCNQPEDAQQVREELARACSALHHKLATAEDQERYLTERIHGTADGGGLVRRVEVLEAALRGLVEELEGSEGVPSPSEPCMPGCPLCLAQIAARAALEAKP